LIPLSLFSKLLSVIQFLNNPPNRRPQSEINNQVSSKETGLKKKRLSGIEIDITLDNLGGVVILISQDFGKTKLLPFTKNLQV